MKSKNIFFVILGAIIIVQFSFFGLKYYSVVDDNNQFGIYNLRNDNIVDNILNKYNVYNVRPLAFFSDVFIFQWFWNNMYVLLVLLLILHLLNIFLIYKIAEKIDIKLNAFCLTLFGLSPVLIEAIYWISASTRIVFSVFLCLLSIFFLLLYFDEASKKKRVFLLIGSIILNLICVGYYEQTIALNLFLFAFVLLYKKRYKYIGIPIVSTIWIGLWYLYFMLNGQMQSRGTLGIGRLFGKIVFIIKRIYILYNNAYSDFKFSLGFGKYDLLSNPIALVLLFALIGGLAYYIFKSRFAVDENKSIWGKIILGLIILIVPFLPFVVLESSIIVNRNLYISTLGLAIIIGTAIDLILKLIKNKLICNIIKTVLIIIFIVPFVISNIEGANNYRKVNALDNKVTNQIINALDKEVFDNHKSISINYDESKLLPYKNLTVYVESIIESDWAITGKLQVTIRDTGIGEIYINTMQDEADVSLFFDDQFNLINVMEKGGNHE